MVVIKKEIEKRHTHLCKGAFIRSREQLLGEDERSTKCFLKELDCITTKGKINTRNENIFREITTYCICVKHMYGGVKTYLAFSIKETKNTKYAKMTCNDLEIKVLKECFTSSALLSCKYQIWKR